MNVLHIAALVALVAVVVLALVIAKKVWNHLKDRKDRKDLKEGLRPYGAPKDMRCPTLYAAKVKGKCAPGTQEVPGNAPAQQCAEWGWVHKENGYCPPGYMPFAGSPDDKCQRVICGASRNGNTKILKEFTDKCANKKINGVSRYKGWDGNWYCPKDRPWDTITNAIVTVNGEKIDRNNTQVRTAAGIKPAHQVACWAQKDYGCAKTLRAGLNIPGNPEWRVEPPKPGKPIPPTPAKPPTKECAKLCSGSLKLCQGGTNNTCCTAKHIPSDGKTLPWTMALAASNAAACAKIPDFSWQGTACLPKECRSRGDAGCEYMCSKFGKCTKGKYGLCCIGANCSAAVGAPDPGCEYKCIQGGKCTADGKGNCCNAAGCVPAADKGCEQTCIATKQCKADGKGNCCDLANKCAPRPRGKRNLSNVYGTSMGGSVFSYSCPTPGSYATNFVVGYDNSPNEIKHITMGCSDGKSSGRQGRRISRNAQFSHRERHFSEYETSKPMTPAPGQIGFQKAYLVTDFEKGKGADRVRAFGVGATDSYVFGSSWKRDKIQTMDCGYFGPGYRITGINGATGSGMDRLQFECSDVAP